MAGDQTHGCAGFKRPATSTATSSMRPKKHKRLTPDMKCTSVKRARVNIGSAIERWRALKAERGLKSDAHVAHCLLDVFNMLLYFDMVDTQDSLGLNLETDCCFGMNSLPSSPCSSGASEEKIKFSQSEVQTLIEQEVDCALKKSETKLQHLIETIQQLDHRVDSESAIQKLEARINTVTQKAEAAFAHMAMETRTTQLPNPPVIRSASEDEALETVQQSKSPADTKSIESTDKHDELFQLMETTQIAVKKMHDDKEALTAAVADVSKELRPPVLTSHGSPELKKEPEYSLEKENNAEAVEEPRADWVKKESLSPAGSKTPKRTKSEQDRPLYPALPPTTFHSVLSVEAASYNIPQKPEVRLALIRNPASLSVLWNVAEVDPSAPPMESYSVYMSMEKAKGSGVFSKWITLGVVVAIPLPMCVIISKYKPGHKVCVAVVGKDKFGRYGPYSEVVTASIPD